MYEKYFVIAVRSITVRGEQQTRYVPVHITTDLEDAREAYRRVVVDGLNVNQKLLIKKGETKDDVTVLEADGVHTGLSTITVDVTHE